MQMHPYQHSVYPDELGFSEDLHYHAHEAVRSSAPASSRSGRETIYQPQR